MVDILPAAPGICRGRPGSRRSQADMADPCFRPLHLWPVLALLLILGCAVDRVSSAHALLRPFTEIDKTATSGLFVALEDGSFGSLKETYQALRSLQVLGTDKPGSQRTCRWLVDSVRSPGIGLKDAYYAMKITEIAHCAQGREVAEVVLPGILSTLKNESASLREFFYATGALSTMKHHDWSDRHVDFGSVTQGIANSVKNLVQGDGTWRFAKHEKASSVNAAGLAFEVVSGLVSMTDVHRHQELVDTLKRTAVKLFKNLHSYEDGTLYFEDKERSTNALATSSSVIRGIYSLASSVPHFYQFDGGKLLGLAKFFLTVGLPSNPEEAYSLLDALGILDGNSVAVPLLLSMPSSSVSLSSKEKLEVTVTTVLGSAVPQVEVFLVHGSRIGSKGSNVLPKQKLHRKHSSAYTLDFPTEQADMGRYKLKFEVVVDPLVAHEYVVPGPVTAEITVKGIVSLSNGHLAVLDSDTGSSETQLKLDFYARNAVKLSANHLQKLALKFELTSPFGSPFSPQQAFLKLRHESNVEHIYLVKSTGKLFELNLDFLGLVEKLYYLSGTYSLELTVGDDAMENPFIWTLGSLELDLPDAPEGAARPPAGPWDLSAKYGAEPEIVHIFRAPEPRPPVELSYGFLVLTLLPLVGFLFGLYVLGLNLKTFPSTGIPLLGAISFHTGIALILGLYVLFWLKLNLFVTLKFVAIFGAFTTVAGHIILAHLADSAYKVKSA